MFVVTDPNNCAVEIRFLAGLLGGVLATSVFVDSQGAQGICSAFKPAIFTVRNVHVTPSFMAAHPVLCQELLEIFKLDGCKWRLLNRDGLDAQIRRINAARARQLIIFHGPQEAAEEFPNSAHKFSSLESAVQSHVICTLDQTRCRSGISATY